MSFRSLRLAIVAAICATSFVSGFAEPAYQARISVSGYSGAGLADFPVLVKISESAISGFSYSDCAADGSDISFASDGEGSVLYPYEIDTWDPTGESFVWVKLPSLAANSEFCFRWGDALPDANTASATWNSNYGGVWHMGEASGTCLNSTSFGSAMDAEPKGNTANSVRYAGTAPVGNARTTATSAALGYLSVPSYSTLGYGSTFTISGWVRFDGVSGYPRLFSRKRSYNEAPGWEIEMQSSSYASFSARGNTQNAISGTLPTLQNAWVHVALVYSGATLSVYGNGALVKSGSITAAGDCDYALSFGCDSDGNEAYVRGQFDECRLMGVAASADWIKAEYDTVKADSFLTYGAAEAIVTTPDLAVGRPSVKSVSANSATFDVNLSAIGENAASADVFLVWGISESAILNTQLVSSALTAKSKVSGTITRLYPERSYYVKAAATNNLGESAESPVVCFTTGGRGDEAGLPGLWQTFFTSANADWSRDVSGIEEDAGNSWKNYSDGNRTKRRELGTLAAYVGGNPGVTKYTSELWGDQVYWPVNGGQWVYWGRMYMDASKVYKFRMKIDDNERVMVTDSVTGASTVLINDTANGNAVNTSAAFTPSASGWQNIEIRMSDGSGGLGGYDTTSSYKNTTNMGWSDDNGSTWNLMIDPGDGSLFRTDGGFAVTAAEQVSGGVLTAVRLDFSALPASTPLYMAYGSANAGTDSSLWDHCVKVADLVAGATSYTCPVPADWGEDDCVVLRFKLGDAPALWSTSVFWRDYTAPGLGAITLDGVGGDTLRVSGSIDSFTGANCTLKVLVGTSRDTLDRVWTGLPGSSLDAPGEYSFALFEPDVNATNYLAPDGIYYACVEAVAGGKISRSETAMVRMSEGAVFASSSSSVSRRTVTFAGKFSDVGMSGASEVSLWAGTANSEAQLSKVGNPITVTGKSQFTIANTFDNFETTYYWQLRAVNVADGGTATNEVRTAVASCKTLDTTTYTWTGNGDEGDWSDPDNWNDGVSGDSLSYPHTASATAAFPAGTKATIVQNGLLTVGTINANSAGVELTFVKQEGMTTNGTKWTFNTINVNASGVKYALNGACQYVGGMTVGANGAIVITNSANLHVTGDFWCQASGARLEVRGDSWFSCNQLGLGGGATSVIDDSTVWTRSHDLIGSSVAGGKLRFEGTHPVFWHNNADGHFKSNLDNANYHLEFVVPIGGYAVAPVRAISSQKNILGYNGGTKQDTVKRLIHVDVADESPANRVDATIATTLISWPNKGISKDLLITGNLPNDDGEDDDEFAWSEETEPRTLGVVITGAAHGNQLQITGVPEEVSDPDVSPAYGFRNIGVGSTINCTAPAGIVQLSATKRASVTGWKLYSVDAATHVRTLVDSGTGNSYSFNNADGLWHELEWQWKVEYLITVSSAGNGTAAAAAEWVETGTKARITVTPAAGYAFGKWTGDVAEESNKDAVLEFTVDNAPYSVTANFIPVIYVAQNGDDANDGSSWATAKATINGALAGGNAVCVMLADGIHEVTTQIAVTTGSTICGANPGCKAIVKAMAKISSDTTAPSSVFMLSHADAVLRNIAVTTDFINGNNTKNSFGAAHNGDFARGVWLERVGLVDSCAITNCRSIYCASWGGGGVYLNKGGAVRNTLIDRNITYASGGNDAKGHSVLCYQGGLVENCIITRGGLVANPSSSASVLLYQGGTLRNCLIAFNSTGHTGVSNPSAVKFDGGGTMENCTVAGNRHAGSTASPAVYISGSDAKIRNSIITGNFNASGECNIAFNGSPTYVAENNCTSPVLSGSGNINADPSFTDADNGDFHIGLSAVVDAGGRLDWMDRLPDLDGNARVSGSAPDMGCYEFAASGLACGFDVVTTGLLGTDRVTLTSRVLGANLVNLVYTWKFTDQAGNITTTNGADLAVLTLPVGVGIYDVELTVANGVDTPASATKPAVFTVYPEELYLALDGANVYPYDSYATAATNLQEAVDAASDGTVIHVGPGWHRTDDTVSIGKGLKLISRDGPADTFFFARAKTSGMPMLVIGNADAVVSGLTISGKDSDRPQVEQWGGITISPAGGMVTNCVICNNKTANISVFGAGARLEAGTVVDCWFTNNHTQCSGAAGYSGGALYITGANALVDRCCIFSNKVSYGATSYGGGVWMNAGTVRNSLIVGNYSVNYGGGATVKGSGKLLNCTLALNTAGTGNGAVWQDGGTVSDCLVYHNTANGVLEDTDDPGFADAVNGDFHLDVASSAVDAGTASGIGDYDLDRNSRVSGVAADKGCYEYDQSQFALGISFAKLNAFAPCSVELAASAMPEGTLLDESQCWWTFDGTEPGVDNYALVGSVVTNEFAAGRFSVRFKTIFRGQTYEIVKDDWFSVFGENVYLRMPGESDPVFPYATRETAATNLPVAINCMQDGSTMIVGEGTYALPNSYTVSKAWTVKSETGNPWSTTFSGRASGQQFVISNPEAVFSGLRFANSDCWSESTVCINAGIVTNCVVDSCRNKNISAAGVTVNGGMIVDSVITNCIVYYDGRAFGGSGLCLNGASAMADRVLVVGGGFGKLNGQQTYATCNGGAYIGANGGTLRNSVILGNSASGCGGVYVCDSANAKVENCTITGNTTANAGSGAGLYVAGDKPQVVNTVVWNNTGDDEVGGTGSVLDHCLVGIDPHFSKSKGREYVPRVKSPCTDAGRQLEWMARAIDFYGSPRVFKVRENRADIGAAECQRGLGTEFELR